MPSPQLSAADINVFVPGTTVDPTPVNANFSNIRTKFNIHTHAAEDITGGTLGAGDFAFQGNITVAGDISGNLNADQLTSGNVADARLSSNVVVKNSSPLFTAGIQVELTDLNTAAYQARGDAETHPRIQVNASGNVLWGSGAATPDTNLYRAGADLLATDDGFRAASVDVRGLADANTRVRLTATGAMEFGNGTDAIDTNLFRSAANVLRTDDTLSVGGDVRIRDLSYVWPSANAAGLLTNNGTGTLTWGTTVPSLTVNNGAGVITERVIGDVSGSTTIDFALRNNVHVRLTGATTFNFTGGAPGGSYAVFIDHNGTHALSWASDVRWDFGALSNLQVGSGKGSLVTLYFRDNKWFATLAGTGFNV